jgi:hypothetical protein
MQKHNAISRFSICFGVYLSEKIPVMKKIVFFSVTIMAFSASFAQVERSSVSTTVNTTVQISNNNAAQRADSAFRSRQFPVDSNKNAMPTTDMKENSNGNRKK